MNQLSEFKDGIDKILEENKALASIGPGILIIGEIIKKTKKRWRTDREIYSRYLSYHNKDLGMTVREYRVEIGDSSIALNNVEAEYLMKLLQS